MDMSETTITTATLTSMHNMQALLADLDGITVEAAEVSGRFENGYTISFVNIDVAVAAIDKAKVRAVTEYLKNGGNPRNKRSIGAQFAAPRKAVLKAAYIYAW